MSEYGENKKLKINTELEVVAIGALKYINENCDLTEPGKIAVNAVLRSVDIDEFQSRKQVLKTSTEIKWECEKCHCDIPVLARTLNDENKTIFVWFCTRCGTHDRNNISFTDPRKSSPQLTNT